MPDGPIFLERQSYRRRRWLDAVRLLPVLGLAFWMVPLLWPFPDPYGVVPQEGVPMSTALQYLFGIWAGLVVGGWLLWRKTRRVEDAVSGDAPQ